MSSLRALLKHDAGAALIEFAIVAPVLMLLFVGIVEVGRYVTFATRIADAARAGAEVGAQSSYNAQATPMPSLSNNTVDKLPSQVACNDSGFTCVASGGSATNNELTATTTATCEVNGTFESLCSETSGEVLTITVTVTGTFTPVLGTQYFGNIPVTASSTLKLQQ